jgi:hypothetical protein
MKKVHVAANPLDAHLVKGVLENENIEAFIRGEFLWNARGEIPVTEETAPSVWIVEDSDYDRALEIIRDLSFHSEASSQDAPNWRCEVCGETNEHIFAECWQCGKERPI